jgi:hypothetical protein
METRKHQRWGECRPTDYLLGVSQKKKDYLLGGAERGDGAVGDGPGEVAVGVVGGGEGDGDGEEEERRQGRRHGGGWWIFSI